MSPKTKLWLRKRALMTLRWLIWHADEWLHRQELKFREELQTVRDAKGRLGVARQASEPGEKREDLFHQRVVPRAKARLPGLSVHRRRGKTAAEFDLSLASRAMPLRFSSR
jgi:hypothetical protein